MNKNQIRQLTYELIKEYEGDQLATYAHVSNRLLGAFLNEELLAIKQELEHQIADEALEAAGWSRSDTGEWRKKEASDFYQRLQAARKRMEEKDNENHTN